MKLITIGTHVRKYHSKKTLDKFKCFTYELLAVFGNGTTAKELAETLGLERETVQRDVIKPYQDSFAGVLEYDPKTRRTELSKTEVLKFCPTNALAITTIAHAEQIYADFKDPRCIYAVPVEDIGLVPDLLEDRDEEQDGSELYSNPFRSLFAALMRKTAVHIDYYSKNGHSSFRFSPHTLVRTSFRLHFRGFCDPLDGRPGMYIDIIADRVEHIVSAEDGTYTGGQDDKDWQRKVRVTTALRKDLPHSLLSALEQEFNLRPGKVQKTRRVRYALAEYVKESLEARRVRGYNVPLWHVEIIED